MNKKEKQVNETGQGLECVKVKKYEAGIKLGGKRAYEESIDRDKISKEGKLAKERLIINRKEKKKIHKVWGKDKNGNWILVHNESNKRSKN